MPPRIAVFTKNRTNPAYVAARYGADQIAARLGASTEHYVPVEPDSVAEQTELIERAIATRPDAFVLTPVHETAMNDAMRHIDAADIPLFNFVTRATAGKSLCFVGADDQALGAEIARYLFAKLGGAGEIVIVEGTPASATSHARMRGFSEALAQYPGITVRAVLPGMYQRDVARMEAARVADAIRGVDAILCANDAMALGVLDALEAAPAAGPQPLVAGVNAVPEAVAAILARRMLASVNFDAMTMCALATEAALRHLRGETVPREIMLPVHVVDASNCAHLNAPIEARVCASWEEVTRPLPAG